MTRFKGSIRDPFLYLGAASTILFVTLIFGAGSVFKLPLHQGEFSVFSASSAEAFNQSNNQNLFVCKRDKNEPLSLNIVQENSLLGISSPATLSYQILASLTDSQDAWSDSSSESGEVTEYLAQSGDTLSTLSKKFGISVSTIAWANNLSKTSSLQPGQKLVILPVSGVLHHVKSGDTLGEIAKTYKAEANDIVSFNELSSAGDIYIGDILVVPDGTMPVVSPSPNYPQVPLASSYFICPIALPCKITQRLHWYNAIDFSHGNCGDAILAAAGGQVLKVKYGYNQGAGNTISVLHPNGVVTSYGHLQTILVNPGNTVSQGQIIALMGGQPGMPGAGKSTGCHVHFGVQGAKNPFSY